MYCDDVTLDGDTVLSTLYAAKKYILPHLERVCIKYLETNVDANNACLLLLSQGEIFEDPELKQRCWDIIDHRAEEVFKSDSFTEIDYQMLEQMLTRGTLRAKETVVFAAATRWAEAECARQGRFVVPEQCREVLGDAFYLLRFPTMSQSEFANDAVQSELLSNKEILDVFLHFNADSKPKLRFPAIPRVELKIAACSRFQFHKAGWSFATAKSNCIRFSVDKAISVAGFGLYGSIQAAEYEVDIGITETDGTVLRLKRHRVSVDGSSNTTHVLFDSPVRIKADTFYTASFVVDYDGHGHYGAGGMSSVTCIDGTKFTFVDSSQSKYTNGLQGQIPEILYYCWPDHFLIVIVAKCRLPYVDFVHCYPHPFMMTSSNGNIFRVTGPLWGEFTGHRWIPLTRASGADLWCFLWSAPWTNSWVNNREAGD